MDKHFTELSGRFCDRIYGTDKGQVRLQRVWESVQKYLPSDRLKVVDVGGGAGHMALLLCEQGHQVTLIEPAEEMIALSIQRLDPFIQSGQASVFRGALQDDHLIKKAILDSSGAQLVDLVVCHAVLEWLNDPRSAIPKLAQYLTPNGYLSLLFYNRNSILIKNLIRGNFYRVQSALLDNQWSGESGSLTPISPLEPEETYQWLREAGLEIVAVHGIRSFFDYMPKPVQKKRSLADILEMERLVADTEPFLSMSRYLHVIAKKV